MVQWRTGSYPVSTGVGYIQKCDRRDTQGSDEEELSKDVKEDVYLCISTHPSAFTLRIQRIKMPSCILLTQFECYC